MSSIGHYLLRSYSIECRVLRKSLYTIALLLFTFWGISTNPIVAQKTITEQQQISPLQAASNDFFGFSLSLDNDQLLVGAYQNDEAGIDAGSVYAFERNPDGSFIQKQQIYASVPASSGRFGLSVDVNDDVAIVSSFELDFFTGQLGSVYIFKKSKNGFWTEQQKISPPEGLVGFFGFQVKFHEDQAFVSVFQSNGSGKILIYQQAGRKNWTLFQELVPQDAQKGMRFGSSLSLNGDQAVIGSYWDSESEFHAGSAYIFEKDENGVWAEQQKIMPAGLAANDFFGHSVSMDQDQLIVGAYGDDEKGIAAGSVYLFEKNSAGNWNKKQKFMASDAAADSRFGKSVAIAENKFIVGASSHSLNGIKSGKAYFFEKGANGTWEEFKKFGPSQFSDDDFFGSQVDLEGDVAAISAYGSDFNGSDAGLAYLFNATGSVPITPRRCDITDASLQIDPICRDGFVNACLFVEGVDLPAGTDAAKAVVAGQPQEIAKYNLVPGGALICLDNLPANGKQSDFFFQAEEGCSIFMPKFINLPKSCGGVGEEDPDDLCDIIQIENGPSICNPDGTYNQKLIIYFNDPPDTGEIAVEINNQWTYHPITGTTQQSILIPNLEADGSYAKVFVKFTGVAGCTMYERSLYRAPDSCGE